MNFEHYGGRRFLLCVGVLLSVTALVAFGRVSGEVYASVIVGTVGAYIIGNVAQKKIEAKAP